MTTGMGIAALAVIVAMAVVVQIRVAAPRRVLPLGCAIGILMAIEYALASWGVLRNWESRPPPIMLLVMISLLLVVRLAFSVTGTAMAKLPFAMLIGLQAFRLPLELVMHHAAAEGRMPVQMSYSGWNFDIVTGITAIPVAWLAFGGKAPRWLLMGWNALGSLLLAAIVGIAVASTPVFAAFGPDRLNTWIADAPFVWLPCVLVPAALLGHLLLWRKLGE